MAPHRQTRYGHIVVQAGTRYRNLPETGRFPSTPVVMLHNVRYATLKADNRFWQLIKWVWATEAERRRHTVSCESEVLCAHARPQLALSPGTNHTPSCTSIRT